MSFFRKTSKPLTFNERLDQMGPQYRAVCGRLTRALAIIEAAASSNPPNMSPTQLEFVVRLVAESGADLAEVQKRDIQPEPTPKLVDAAERYWQYQADAKRLSVLLKDVRNCIGEAPLGFNENCLFVHPDGSRA